LKLGLSQACYRWVFYNHLRRDTPAYAMSGKRLPYFSSVPVAVDENQAVEWLIERCASLGLEYLHVTTTLLRDAVHANEIRELGAGVDVNLIAGASANWVATGDEWKQEFVRYTGALPIAAAAGARILCTTHAAPTIHNHFSKDPPIERQIEIMIGNFREAARVAEDHGIVIAFENHLDYRASEIARVIDAVGSRALRANLDTANPVAVIEDPVDAARAVGRYAVMAHLKDFRIQAMTLDGEPRILWAPIGRGNIDLGQVLAVLQAEAADPDHLPLCLEVAAPHEHDPDVWVRDSLDYVRRRFPQFLT
jgi:sugar phosphate isomerase/epimerase